MNVGYHQHLTQRYIFIKDLLHWKFVLSYTNTDTWNGHCWLVTLNKQYVFNSCFSRVCLSCSPYLPYLFVCTRRCFSFLGFLWTIIFLSQFTFHGVFQCRLILAMLFLWRELWKQKLYYTSALWKLHYILWSDSFTFCILQTSTVLCVSVWYLTKHFTCCLL